MEKFKRHCKKYESVLLIIVRCKMYSIVHFQW